MYIMLSQMANEIVIKNNDLERQWSEVIVLHRDRSSNPRGWGSQISRQSACEGSKVVSPTHRRPIPSRKYFWYLFLSEADSTPWP